MRAKNLVDSVKDTFNSMNRTTKKIAVGAAFLTTLTAPLVAENANINVHVEDLAGNPVEQVESFVGFDGSYLDSMTTNLQGDGLLQIVNVAINPENPLQPDAFYLNQNYPNPFNPSTTIEFATTSPGQLIIYNILGQEVAKKNIPSPGQYQATWGGGNAQGTNVAAGVYLYSIMTEDGRQTKRMTLVDKGNGAMLDLNGTGNSIFSKQIAKAANSNYLFSFQGAHITNLDSIIEVLGDMDLTVAVNRAPYLATAFSNQSIALGDSIPTAQFLSNFYNDNGTVLVPRFIVPSDTGNFVYQITAIDSMDTNLVAIANLNVGVYQGNRAPTIALPDTISLFEDQALGNILDLLGYSNDADNDNLIFNVTYQSNPALVNAIANGDSLAINAILANGNGSSMIRVSATDGEYTAIDSTVLNVEAVNDAPHFLTEIDSQSIDEDQMLTFALDGLVNDYDHNLSDLTAEVTGLGTDATYVHNSENNTVVVIPNDDWNGNLSDVRLRVSDGEYTAESNPFNITVNPVNDAPNINVTNQNIVEDSSLDSLVNLLENSSDIDGDSLIFSLTSQENPELVNLIIENNQLMMDSLQANGYGSSIIGLRAFDGALADTSYFTLTVESRADITFILKDVCADTVMSSDTSRFFFDGVEYTSQNGILTRQLEPGTIEFDATNPNSIDGMAGTGGATYLMLRFPGQLSNFEERDRVDTSSPITPGTTDTTIICYKIPADFDISNARTYMNAGGIFGTIRVGDADLFGPAWYNTASGVIDSTTRAWQQELFGTILSAATGKLNLQYVEQDTAPGEQNVDFYHETYYNSGITSPSHGEVWNENNELTYATVEGSPGESKATRWAETMQSIGIRYGDPNSFILHYIDGNMNNPELTHTGHQWLRALYQANPDFHF